VMFAWTLSTCSVINNSTMIATNRPPVSPWRLRLLRAYWYWKIKSACGDGNTDTKISQCMLVWVGHRFVVHGILRFLTVRYFGVQTLLFSAESVRSFGVTYSISFAASNQIQCRVPKEPPGTQK